MQPTLSLKEFDYSLPQKNIALYPANPRDACKLLVFQNGQIRDMSFKAFPSLLSSEHGVVLNNTKVIHARFLFPKKSLALAEVFCLEPYNHTWIKTLDAFSPIQCICQTKGWKSGTLEHTKEGITLSVSCVKVIDDKKIVEFAWDKKITFESIVQVFGTIPIPPYLKRASDTSDIVNYQPLYAEHLGSVASPTSGLHFTENIFAELKTKNIDCHFLTLNISSDTFKPIQEENINKHQMHGEQVQVSRQFLEEIIQKKSSIVCCGTTSLRALESVLFLGEKMTKEKNIDMQHLSQQDFERDCMTMNNTFYESAEVLLEFLQKTKKEAYTFTTSIMIKPPYKPKSCHALLTNFHQPKSSLLLLIASLVGEKWKAIYSHALQNDYQFLSYGDCSLLFNE